VGAREIVQTHAAQVLALEVADPGVLADVDTREDLASLARLRA
jgi:CTP:molybdopterin cytidylyltransferase MocA